MNNPVLEQQEHVRHQFDCFVKTVLHNKLRNYMNKLKAQIKKLQYLQSCLPFSFQVYISQPTISESIKKLEEELSITLLNRQKNSVTLTDLGQEIYDIALQIVSQFERIQEISHRESFNVNNALQGNLKISVSTGIIHGCLENVLPFFKNKYPNVTLSVIEYGVYELLDLVSTQKCDIAITIVDQNKYWQEHGAKLKYRCLATEDFYALVPANSPLANKNSISIRELVNYPLAALSCNHSINLNDMLNDLSSFQIVFATNDFQLLQDYIVQNNVIAFPVNASILQSFSHNVRIKAIKVANNFKAKIYYLYHNDNPQKDLIEAFIEVLENEFIRQ